MYVGGCKCIPPSGGGGADTMNVFLYRKISLWGDGVKGIIQRDILKVILADFHSVLYKM